MINRLGPGSLVVRFTDPLNNVNIVKEDLMDYINFNKNTFKANFTIERAQVIMDMSRVSINPNDDSFYPLRIYCHDRYGQIVLMCSEFRTGYHGESVTRLIECLKELGFRVTHRDIEDIYNNAKVDASFYLESSY